MKTKKMGKTSHSVAERALAIGIALLFIGSSVTAKSFDKAAEISDNLNPFADPCTDFYEYACGNFKLNRPWQETSETNYFDVQNEQIQSDIETMLMREIPLEHQTAPEAYLRTFYKKCQEDIPLENDEFYKLRNKINEIFDSHDIIKTMAKVNRLGLSSLVSVGITANPYNTSEHVLALMPPSSPLLVKVFEALRKEKTRSMDGQEVLEFIAGSLSLLDRAEEDDLVYLQEAIEIKALAAELAKLAVRPPATLLKDFFNTYTLGELDKLSDFDWTKYLEEVMDGKVSLSPNDTVIVYSKDYLMQIPQLIESRAPQILNYMKWSVLVSHGFFTGDQFRDHAWKFVQSQLGAPLGELFRKNWVRGLCRSAIDTSASEILARMYIDNFAGRKDKENAEVLVRTITASFRHLIENKDWMDEETRNAALRKLDSIKDNVAYPDWLVNDTLLEREYHFLSKKNLTVFEGLFDLAVHFHESVMTEAFASLRKPVDRDHEWPMSPITVNAAYSPLQNTITIPVSILQGVFFDKKYPKYVNYAQLGSIIGHELTHAFDTTGAQTDANGNIADWWTHQTHDEFAKRTKCLVDQYSEAYFKSPYYKYPIQLNAYRTLGENIADNGGIREAFKAWKNATNGKPEKPLEGLEFFSDEQMFFLAYANNWCNDPSPADFLSQLLMDPHSPSQVRVNFVLANFYEFAKAFDCPIDTPMNPIKTCKVW